MLGYPSFDSRRLTNHFRDFFMWFRTPRNCHIDLRRFRGNEIFSIPDVFRDTCMAAEVIPLFLNQPKLTSTYLASENITDIHVFTHYRLARPRGHGIRNGPSAFQLWSGIYHDQP